MRSLFRLGGRVLIPAIALSAIASCSAKVEEGISIKPSDNGGYELYIDGVKTFITGVGGTNALSIAAENGANAFRTWGGNVESIKKNIELAQQNNMYIMQGIGMSKRHEDYLDQAYRDTLKSFVRTLAETFKDDKNILIWGIGNEIALDGSNSEAEWSLVNEMSEIIKSIDKRHLTSTVISHNPQALDSLAKYCPSLDVVGINSYGGIENIASIVDESAYKGAYIITEWGPTGWWECDKTSWGAPIEQTSEQKRIVYESRYNAAINGPKKCLGSFCFLWGQKEERTPTWFCMFVENNVDGLPLSGEKTPMVEAMQRVWTKQEPCETAPVVTGMTIEGKPAIESPMVAKGKPFKAVVDVTDKEQTDLTYVWENLYEATVTATGGAWEPRPDRVGEVIKTTTPEVNLTVKEKGNYRLYCYILDGTGFCSTVNVPYQVN